jgi:hypothetical protein
MSERDMSWLTGALEQATAMAPPTERHAIHKLWTKMEDATADRSVPVPLFFFFL